MNILLISASHRPASLNRKLMQQVHDIATKQGHNCDWPDYASLDMPMFNDHEREQGFIPDVANTLAEKVTNANAIIISSPEYNWAYPASLKNIIDWLSIFRPTPFTDKPVLLMSASLSERGGVMGIEQLKTPLNAMGSFVYPQAFALGQAQIHVENEALTLPSDKIAHLTTLLDAFLQHSARL